MRPMRARCRPAYSRASSARKDSGPPTASTSRSARAFENTLVSQSEPRTLEQSMEVGWSLLAGLPVTELTRLSDAQIAAHLHAKIRYPMSEASPTRAVVLELKDEQRAMHEGYVFLDEKCLLLAGEILRELENYAKLDLAMLAAHQAALQALQGAVARHGLQGLAGVSGARPDRRNNDA